MFALFLVEDHKVLARTLTLFLSKQEGFSVVATAETAEEALVQLPQLAVDLVVVDVALPAMNGIDLVAVLRERFPALPCLMLSGHTELNYVRRALAAGARGYVMKGDPFALPEAVRTVLAGEIYLSEDVRQNLAE